MTNETPFTPEVEAIPVTRCTDCGATEPGGTCTGPNPNHNWGVFTEPVPPVE